MNTTRQRLAGAAQRGGRWLARRVWVWLWAGAVAAAMWWWWPSPLPGRGPTTAVAFALAAAAGLVGAWFMPRTGFTAAVAATSLLFAAAAFTAASLLPMCTDDAWNAARCGPSQAFGWAVAALLAGAVTIGVHIPVTAWRTLKGNWKARRAAREGQR